MSNPSFRGPHKVNFHTKSLGHNLAKRLSQGKYESIIKFRKSYVPSDFDVVVVHYSFLHKFCLIIKYIISCIFPKK